MCYPAASMGAIDEAVRTGPGIGPIKIPPTRQEIADKKAGMDARKYAEELLRKQGPEAKWITGLQIRWSAPEKPISTKVLFDPLAVVFEEEGLEGTPRRIELYVLSPSGVDLISGMTGDSEKFSNPHKVKDVQELELLNFRLAQIPRSE